MLNFLSGIAGLFGLMSRNPHTRHAGVHFVTHFLRHWMSGGKHR